MSKRFLDKDGQLLVDVYDTDEIVANPTLDGTEGSLAGLQIGDTKYKITGGGGGSDYTAGDGVEINNDVISVDRASVQKKLVAGDDIDITTVDSNTERVSFSSSLTEQDIEDLFSEYLDSNASFVEYTDPETSETNYILNIPRNASYEENATGYTLVVDTDDANLDDDTASFGEK